MVFAGVGVINSAESQRHLCHDYGFYCQGNVKNQNLEDRNQELQTWNVKYLKKSCGLSLKLTVPTAHVVLGDAWYEIGFMDSA